MKRTLRNHSPTSVASFISWSLELGFSACGGDRLAASSSSSAILFRLSLGTDTEDVLRRLRATGAYLSMDRRRFLSLMRLWLRLRLRLRESWLALRERPRLRLRLTLWDEYRRLRVSLRSLLRLKRRSSRDLRAFAISAVDSFLSSREE